MYSVKISVDLFSCLHMVYLLMCYSIDFGNFVVVTTLIFAEKFLFVVYNYFFTQF